MLLAMWLWKQACNDTQHNSAVLDLCGQRWENLINSAFASIQLSTFKKCTANVFLGLLRVFDELDCYYWFDWKMIKMQCPNKIDVWKSEASDLQLKTTCSDCVWIWAAQFGFPKELFDINIMQYPRCSSKFVLGIGHYSYLHLSLCVVI